MAPATDSADVGRRSTGSEPIWRPAMVSRADWGADESLMGWPTEYTPTTKAVSIHHTAGTNDYTCADAAGLIRAIYRYHAVDLDWGDIGYSALVDKCGTVFESRSGGLQLLAIGAHTGGFNTTVSESRCSAPSRRSRRPTPSSSPSRRWRHGSSAAATATRRAPRS